MKARVVALSLLLAVFSPFALSQTVGTAYFSSTINWSQTPDLYFTVTGGPPNTCGDLYSTRNGSPLFAPGWLCTDANGNATKGPWTWSGTPGNQTDTGIHIGWPNGTATYATSDHVWDKSCPVVQITSSGTPPTTFQGTIVDDQWGAGMDDGWTHIRGTYFDVTAQTYWNGTSWVSTATEFDATVSPLPSHSSTFSIPGVPPASAHTPGDQYLWSALSWDGDNLCTIDSVTYSYTF